MWDLPYWVQGGGLPLSRACDLPGCQFTVGTLGDVLTLCASSLRLEKWGPPSPCIATVSQPSCHCWKLPSLHQSLAHRLGFLSPYPLHTRESGVTADSRVGGPSFLCCLSTVKSMGPTWVTWVWMADGAALGVLALHYVLRTPEQGSRLRAMA